MKGLAADASALLNARIWCLEAFIRCGNDSSKEDELEVA